MDRLNNKHTLFVMEMSPFNFMESRDITGPTKMNK